MLGLGRGRCVVSQKHTMYTHPKMFPLREGTGIGVPSSTPRTAAVCHISNFEKLYSNGTHSWSERVEYYNCPMRGANRNVIFLKYSMNIKHIMHDRMWMLESCGMPFLEKMQIFIITYRCTVRTGKAWTFGVSFSSFIIFTADSTSSSGADSVRRLAVTLFLIQILWKK